MYFCKSLTPPNIDGLQTCTEWATFDFPSFTPEEAAALTSYIILSFVAVWCFKQLGNLIKNFK